MQRLNKRLVWVYETLRESYGPQYWWPADTPFEVIVGAILTQNTSWKNAEKAIDEIKRKGLMNPGALLKIRTEKLAKVIRPAGYHNLKSKRLKNFLRYYADFCGLNFKTLKNKKVSTLRKELLSVNGIGPETADSILLYACQKTVFVVDAYTRRIFFRQNIISKDATYDIIQSIATSALPGSRALFNEFHALIVKHGKDMCKKVPKCGICPIKNGCGYDPHKKFD